MGKGLYPVTGSPTGTDIKQGRSKAGQTPAELVRPIMPMDTNAISNEAPRIGRVNPKHINMMFAFGKQSYRGTVPYGPLGSTHDTYTENDRDIIKSLGQK